MNGMCQGVFKFRCQMSRVRMSFNSAIHIYSLQPKYKTNRVIILLVIYLQAFFIPVPSSFQGCNWHFNSVTELNNNNILHYLFKHLLGLVLVGDEVIILISLLKMICMNVQYPLGSI